jgi:hypothetical protein
MAIFMVKPNDEFPPNHDARDPEFADTLSLAMEFSRPLLDIYYLTYYSVTTLYL